MCQAQVARRASAKQLPCCARVIARLLVCHRRHMFATFLRRKSVTRGHPSQFRHKRNSPAAGLFGNLQLPEWLGSQYLSTYRQLSVGSSLALRLGDMASARKNTIAIGNCRALYIEKARCQGGALNCKGTLSMLGLPAGTLKACLHRGKYALIACVTRKTQVRHKPAAGNGSLPLCPSSKESLCAARIACQ